LDLAAQRWPSEPRSKLLLRLVHAGGVTLEQGQNEITRNRQDASGLARVITLDTSVVIAHLYPRDPNLANLRASSGLKLPDCCALDTALTTATASTLATFGDALAKAARQHYITVAPDAGSRSTLESR